VTLIVLQEQFGLPEAGDSSPAMALNGGIGYSGATCGAITGAALAVGRLAGHRLPDHTEAKGEARALVQALMVAFTGEFGSADCRQLTGYDFREPGAHHDFIQSGIWRTACLRQIEFALTTTLRLVDQSAWAPSGQDGRTPRTLPPAPAGPTG
jgi:C_GCAxxG_C_C family probable redox protein